MVRFTGGLLLFTALATATPTLRNRVRHQDQHVLSDSPKLLQPGNPRNLKGKFLHITDFHPDPFYKIGTNPSGHHPCHAGKHHNETGYYGAPATGCDSPFTLVDATFKWIEENIKDEIDFVIYTGDGARHDNDRHVPRSERQILDLNRYVVDKFTEVFGKPENFDDPDPTNDFVIPIVPTYGNNDILPHNIFSPGPNEWTRRYLEIWNKFIPEEQEHSFARGGWFYAEVIPNKLAVISLNTLYFFDSNSAVDGCNLKSEPGYEHMEWLRIQLQFLRERGLKAILIGHVPPARTRSKRNWDETCYQKYLLWQRQYRDVIVANFFGHMNLDHYMFHDIKDLAYNFEIDGVDNDPNLELIGRNFSNDTEFHIEGGKAKYLSELRNAWSDLPKPPEGTDYSSVDDDERWTEGKRKQRSNFLKQIGGPLGERYTMSFVSPSIVPNYFPTLRILEYNMTGLENDHPAMGLPQGRLAKEKDLKHHPMKPKEASISAEDAVHIDKKKHRKKGKHHKKPRLDPDFPIPLPPSELSLPGPAHLPQTFSLLSWTQLYANLTLINQLVATVQALPANEEQAYKKTDPFDYRIEYTTGSDDTYNLTDLTIRHWLDLAERMGRTIYQVDEHNEDDENDSLDPRRPLSDTSTISTNAEQDDSLDILSDDVESEKKKKKKKKKKHWSVGRLRDNLLWHEFVRRAFVHALPDKDLEHDFDR